MKKLVPHIHWPGVPLHASAEVMDYTKCTGQQRQDDRRRFRRGSKDLARARVKKGVEYRLRILVPHADASDARGQLLHRRRHGDAAVARQVVGVVVHPTPTPRPPTSSSMRRRPPAIRERSIAARTDAGICLRGRVECARAAQRVFSYKFLRAHMKGYHAALLAASPGTALVISGLAPHDRTTWWLEVFPVLIGAPILVATARALPAHTARLHAARGARGDPVRGRSLHLCARCRSASGCKTRSASRATTTTGVGHFGAGFRARAARARDCCCAPRRCNAAAGCFARHRHVSRDQRDLRVHRVVGGAARRRSGRTRSCGTQGDVWDTQWDMFLALMGALTAQLLLGRAHDRALARGCHDGHAALARRRALALVGRCVLARALRRAGGCSTRCRRGAGADVVLGPRAERIWLESAGVRSEASCSRRGHRG